MNKIVLVTGAAQGIGKAIVDEFCENGYTVIMVDYSAQNLESSFSKLTDLYSNIKLYRFVCDVGNSTQVNKLINELTDQQILPNILVNNAGYGGPFQVISDIDDTEWDQVINTNLRSIFNFTRKLLLVMRNNGWGKIINIASVQGLIGANLSSSYIASKHGVVGYTKAIAAEWGKYGITCNAICPGYVDTNMGAQDDKIPEHYTRIISRTPAGKLAKPKDIAYLVDFLASDKANFINGSIITIDGGLMADIGIS